MVEKLPGLINKIETMKGTSLTQLQQEDFALKAQFIRWPELRGVKDVEERDLLLIDREEDKGSNLWNVFNRVQEKIINGGIYTLRDRKVRKVKNFNQAMRINSNLWSLAESYLN